MPIAKILYNDILYVLHYWFCWLFIFFNIYNNIIRFNFCNLQYKYKELLFSHLTHKYTHVSFPGTSINANKQIMMT